MSQPAKLEPDHGYPHPPAKLWKALTTPEWHARWWAAGDVKPVVEGFDLDRPMDRAEEITEGDTVEVRISLVLESP